VLVSLLCATQVHSEAVDPILLKFMGVYGPHSQFAESAHATYFPGLVAEVNDDVDHFVIGFEGFADFHGGSTTKKDGGLDLQIGTPINGNIMPYVRIGLTASWPHTRLHDGGGVEYKFAKAWGVAGEYAGDTTQCRDGPGYEAHSHRAAWQRRHQRRQSRARRVMHERLRPKRHRFTYLVFYVRCDLDRLASLDSGCSVSTVGGGPVSIGVTTARATAAISSRGCTRNSRRASKKRTAVHLFERAVRRRSSMFARRRTACEVSMHHRYARFARGYADSRNRLRLGRFGAARGAPGWWRARRWHSAAIARRPCAAGAARSKRGSTRSARKASTRFSCARGGCIWRIAKRASTKGAPT
jgi:outer membrane immunogenic protein